MNESWIEVIHLEYEVIKSNLFTYKELYITLKDLQALLKLCHVNEFLNAIFKVN